VASDRTSDAKANHSLPMVGATSTYYPQAGKVGVTITMPVPEEDDDGNIVRSNN